MAKQRSKREASTGDLAPPGIVFSDLDGTFLARDKTIPPGNLQVAKRMAALGIPLVPCTGRPLAGVTASVLGLPKVRYLVLANGTGIWDLKAAGEGTMAHGESVNGSFIYRRPMDKEAFRRVYEQVSELPITIDLFADGRAYSERNRLRLLESFGVEPHLLAQILRSRTPVDEPLPELLSKVEQVERLSVYYATPQERTVVLAAIAKEPTLQATSSELTNVEAQDVLASKGAALLWLCERLCIDPAHSVAFGDGMNDVSMLEAAGDGVAMADAQPGVAAFADHITRLGCSAGGVGDYLMSRYSALAKTLVE